MISQPTRRPGVMVVHPRLKSPSPTSASTFSRWTKLHFRDMLNMPTPPQLGRMTHALRFTVPEDSDGKYNFDKSKGTHSPYFYTCHVEDVGIVQSEAYYGVSRQLDLESTRELGEGEERVGQEGSVFDVVDAEFGVFEEVMGVVPSKAEIGSYQNLTLPLSTQANGSSPSTHLIALSIKTPEPDTFTPKGMVPPSVLGIQASLLSYLSSGFSSKNSFQINSSLYRHLGSEAQPAMHPEMDCEARGKWLLTALLVDGEAELGSRKEVEEWVGQWADAVEEGEKSVQVTWGVWGGEALLS